MSSCWIAYFHRQPDFDRLMPRRYFGARVSDEQYAEMRAKEDEKMAAWRKVCDEVEGEHGYVGAGNYGHDELIEIESKMKEVIRERWRNRTP